MCGRYYLVSSIELIARLFGVAAPSFGLAPRYNIAPQQRIPVVRARPSRELAMVSWGFVPNWASDLKQAHTPINARCETIREKPMFRVGLAQQRCIVPADGWYEWQVDPATGTKTPRLMRVLDNAGQPTCFAMAGVWDAWTSRDADPSRRVEHESCAIITTPAAESCAHVHDRMPAILPMHAWDRWLDPSEHDTAALAAMLRPLDSATITITRVSTRANSPRNDCPALIEPDDGAPEPGAPASKPRGRSRPEDPSQGSLFGA